MANDSPADFPSCVDCGSPTRGACCAACGQAEDPVRFAAGKVSGHLEGHVAHRFLALAVTVFVGCGEAEPPAPTAKQPSPVRAQRAQEPSAKELDKVDLSTPVNILVPPGEPLTVTAAKYTRDAYEKLAQAEERLRAFLEGGQTPTPKNLQKFFRPVVSARSYYGDQAGAVKAYSDWAKHLDPLVANNDPGWVTLIGARALALMRLGEVENAINRVNSAASIFPPLEGGMHPDDKWAKKAVALWNTYLKHRPNDIGGHWLINVAAMMAGSWPHSVPPKLRMPPSTFASEGPCLPFSDSAPSMGIDVLSTAGGVAIEDFHQDGYFDLVFTGWLPDEPMRILRGGPGGRFRDVTAEAGLGGQTGGLNVTHADYNNDGFSDIYVIRGAWNGAQRNSLLRNRGDGTFEDVTVVAGLASPYRPGQGAAWADYDLDGDLDLFVIVEGSPKHPFPCQFFRNNGDETFTEIATEAGVDIVEFGKSVAFGDIDNDGDPDLFVSAYTSDNYLFLNEGDGTFRDISKTSGLGSFTKSFASWFFDYDQDGWLDLLVASFYPSLQSTLGDLLDLPGNRETMHLYRNLKGKGFKDVTEQTGMDRTFIVMGANWGDFDSDGFPDMYLGTGAPSFMKLVPNTLLKNDRGKRFLDVTTAARVGHLGKGHGIAFADLDHDGGLDIILEAGGMKSGDAARNVVFRNPGFGNHWLGVQVVGTESNAMGVGTRITVRLASVGGADNDALGAPGGSATRYAVVGTGGSFGSSPHEQHIGLGQHSEIEELEVFWPASGQRQKFTDVSVDTRIRVTEGQATLEVVSRPD